MTKTTPPASLHKHDEENAAQLAQVGLAAQAVPRGIIRQTALEGICPLPPAPPEPPRVTSQ
jgi:hypothetical protein